MIEVKFSKAVFVNCPFDDDYAPLLEAALFCIIYFGFTPRLANESLEAGENRLDKITNLIFNSQYSIHDLSRCCAKEEGEFLRMNMPFEFGIDVGVRRSGIDKMAEKKFLIFEENPYDLKQGLSDIAGQDVEFHKNDFEVVIQKIRNFFRVEAGVPAPGPSKLLTDYSTFQGWMTEKKIEEGHSEMEALELPTREILDEMKKWVHLKMPDTFIP